MQDANVKPMASPAEEGSEQQPLMDVVRNALFRGRAYLVLILLLVYFSLASDAFLQTSNLLILTKHVAINALLGIGMTFVILTGGIDLSVGSIVGLCGMIAGALVQDGLLLEVFGVTIYFNVWIVMLITVGVGTLLGWVNGAIITRFNVAPFIVTLGMLYVARGMALLSNSGATFSSLSGKEELGNLGFPTLGKGVSLAGIGIEGVEIPYSIPIMIVIAIIAAFIAAKTPFGRQVYAIGGNESAAKLSGVRVKRVTTLTYAISGFCAAVVGLIVTSQLVSAHPATGNSWELRAIAAVVLGGTSLAGGRGAIGGTIIGAFVIGVLTNGMILMGVTSFWQQIIMGIVIVLAVVLDQVQQRLQERSVIR
jgi:erythritol transport system permease protein